MHRAYPKLMPSRVRRTPNQAGSWTTFSCAQTPGAASQFTSSYGYVAIISHLQRSCCIKPLKMTVSATEGAVHHSTAPNANANARDDHADRRTGLRDSIDVHAHHLRYGAHGCFVSKMNQQSPKMSQVTQCFSPNRRILTRSPARTPGTSRVWTLSSSFETCRTCRRSLP